MIRFLLNNKLVEAEVPTGTILLDYIRENKKLKGTKSACREGDCGSCAVLIGSITDNELNYKAITSCITPLGNIHGKHVVTIEGLNQEQISPVQQALIDAAAIQCGYCTPGIVLSLTGYILSNQEYSFDSAKDAIAGNICRCTGYKSIERALELVLKSLESIGSNMTIKQLINARFLPSYFSDIKLQLSSIQNASINGKSKLLVGGGTDLYVQKPDELIDKDLVFISDNPELNKISVIDNICRIGAACKVSDLFSNNLISSRIPEFGSYIKLIASNLIRNIATIGGNVVNASPIGDLSILFLSLNASLTIKSASNTFRKVKLEDFFISYKKIDLTNEEHITEIEFELPNENCLFNFEKVSKRRYLDIASVNSAFLIEIEENVIKIIRISVGGVSPIPLFLSQTCNYLNGKALTPELVKNATEILNQEISPITDVRGSAEYKRLLARQLFFAHFLKFFPNRFDLNELTQ